jgi:AraC-like DNA-binding protein
LLKAITAQIEEKVSDICNFCQYTTLSYFTTYFCGKVYHNVGLTVEKTAAEDFVIGFAKH